MKNLLFYPAGTTAACGCAAGTLESAGIPLTDHPSPEITHLLLDAPSFDAGGMLRGGGDPDRLLERLPEDVTVVGGKLDHPALAGYAKLDLLEDPMYLAENAAITADCALRIAGQTMETTFRDTPALVIGWGRIGKCLARNLRALGAEVTVAARKETDRALLKALGYIPLDTGDLEGALPRFRAVYNTVPLPLLSREALENAKNCLLIDLASRLGLEHETVIWARGLPGKLAPESSGALMARRILELCKEAET